jgi:hypothetical protein
VTRWPFNLFSAERFALGLVLGSRPFTNPLPAPGIFAED